MARQKFVVLAHTRTGSTYLVGLLNSHPEITCYGELFQLKEPPFGGSTRIINDMDPAYQSSSYRREHYEEFFNDFFKTSDDVLGCKLMAGQSMPALIYTAMEPDIKVIYLNRDNILAAYSSELITRASKEAVAATGQPLEERPKAVFDAKDFEQKCKSRQGRHDFCLELLKRSRKDYVTLEYNDLSLPETKPDVLEFLGVGSGVNLQSDSEKRNTSDIVSRFTEPDEVMKYLEETGRTAWASEGPQS